MNAAPWGPRFPSFYERGRILGHRFGCLLLAAAVVGARFVIWNQRRQAAGVGFSISSRDVELSRPLRVENLEGDVTGESGPYGASCCTRTAPSSTPKPRNTTCLGPRPL